MPQPSPRSILPFGLCILLAAGILPAQEIKVWSEFQRIDPFGNVVPVDRVDHPREILSPAVARNAWTSFHVALTIAANSPSFLYIQQNPEWFQIKLYREHFTKTAQGWIPDRLSEVKPPCTVLLPDLSEPIPAQTTLVYWLDVWVPDTAAVGRMRMQVVLKSGDRWLVYPMEVRVLSAVVPKVDVPAGRLAQVTARADAFVRPGGPDIAGALSVRRLIQRNAAQDEALARDLKVTLPKAPPELGAEGYLKLRDFLLRR